MSLMHCTSELSVTKTFGRNGLDQFVLGYDAPGVARQIGQDIEGFGPQLQRAIATAQACRVRVDHELAEPKHFLRGRQHDRPHGPSIGLKPGGLSLLSALFQRSFTTARGRRGYRYRPRTLQRRSPCWQRETCVLAAIPGLGLSTASIGSARANVIVDWNAKAELMAVKKKMLPPPNARGMAIMHIAMFEAVNAVERRYAPYRLNLTAARNVSKEAAAAAAAHAVLMALHPGEQEVLNAALLASLG